MRVVLILGCMDVVSRFVVFTCNYFVYFDLCSVDCGRVDCTSGVYLYGDYRAVSFNVCCLIIVSLCLWVLYMSVRLF